MATWFCDGSATGSDSNDGRDNIGAGLATADWTESTFTLTQSSHGYTFAAGDVIYVSAGTGVTVGLYEVASSTADDIVLVETSTLRTIGNASDLAAGDLSNSDITSSDGPFLTINTAIDGGGSLVAGETVWIRGGTDYVTTAFIDTAGTGANPIALEGYTTTLGDDGKATIDGTDNTLANGINSTIGGDVFYCIKNILVRDMTSEGFSMGAADFVIYKRCEATLCAGWGFRGDNGMMYEECTAHGNTSDGGFSSDLDACIVGCQSFDNTGIGFEFDTGAAAFCVAYGNTTLGFVTAQSGWGFYFNCTVDGENAGGTTGLSFTSGTINQQVVVNCIGYDCNTGFSAGRNTKEFKITLHNLISSNNTDYNNFETFTGEVAAAPGFTDEASADYTLTSGSAAKAAGVDAGTVVNDVSYVDIGAHQRQEPAGGGGGLMTHPGMSGGARG